MRAFCDLMRPIMSDIIDIGVASKDINYVLYSGENAITAISCCCNQRAY